MRPLWAQTAAGALVVVATVGVVVLPSRLLGSERRTELPLPNAPRPSVIQAHAVRVPVRRPRVTIAPVIVRQPVQAHITLTKPAPTVEASFVVHRTTAPRHVGQPKVATAPTPAVTPSPPAPTTTEPATTAPAPTTPTVTTTTPPAPTPVVDTAQPPSTGAASPTTDKKTQKHDQPGKKQDRQNGHKPNPPSPPQQIASPKHDPAPAPTPPPPADPGNGNSDNHGGHDAPPPPAAAPPPPPPSHGHDHHK